MYGDLEAACCESSGGIIGKEERSRVLDGYTQRVRFPVMERQESGKRQQVWGNRAAGNGVMR